jgi:hypothetical protein
MTVLEDNTTILDIPGTPVKCLA